MPPGAEINAPLGANWFSARLAPTGQIRVSIVDSSGAVVSSGNATYHIQERAREFISSLLRRDWARRYATLGPFDLVAINTVGTSSSVRRRVVQPQEVLKEIAFLQPGVSLCLFPATNALQVWLIYLIAALFIRSINE